MGAASALLMWLWKRASRRILEYYATVDCFIKINGMYVDQSKF